MNGIFGLFSNIAIAAPGLIYSIFRAILIDWFSSLKLYEQRRNQSWLISLAKQML